MYFGCVLRIPVQGLFILPLDVTGDFIKYFCTSLLFINGKPSRKPLLMALVSAVAMWAEYTIVHVLELILLVENCMYVTGLRFFGINYIFFFKISLISPLTGQARRYG